MAPGDKFSIIGEANINTLFATSGDGSQNGASSINYANGETIDSDSLPIKKNIKIPLCSALFTNLKFKDVIFSNVRFDDTFFIGCSFERVAFYNVEINRAIFSNNTFDTVVFNNVTFSDSRIENAEFETFWVKNLVLIILILTEQILLDPNGPIPLWRMELFKK